MEEKKLDTRTVIGFVLIFAILMYMLWQNQPTPEERAQQEAAKKEQLATEKNENSKLTDTTSSGANFPATAVNDSIQLIDAKQQLGAFAYSAGLVSKPEKVKVETNVFDLTFDSKGGYLSELKLKKFVDYNNNPIYIIKDGNAVFNLNFTTSDGRVLNTQNLNFEPTVTTQGDNTVVSMKLKVSANQYLEYLYVFKPNDYMVDFSISSQGLADVFNNAQPVDLSWKLKTYRHAKSVQYENRYTEVIYEYDNGKDDYLGQQEFTDDAETDITYVAFKQHFFTSILLANSPFNTGTITSKNLVEDEAIDTVFTKEMTAKLPLVLNGGGNLNKSLNWYYGPSDYKVLNDYDRNLDETISLGWGIFGWINKFVFIPVFGFLGSFLPYGIAIIVLTILVRLAMSPVTYKSYVSQAKMKVLKPEISEISAKYKDNPMKRQQETMALYSKAGASPLAGCLPALMQLPVFYALFMFFPSAFDLRQKSFLWAEDLSSYDTIATLPFNIPFYGNHVSLFPILASVAIFFYMRMTTGQQIASQPTQEGLPDMGKIMKYMIYFSPIMMLFFFNNYASGLSLYYFISNLITIGIMLVIKNYIIDEDKIHNKIEANKKKPKKQSRFQKKMKEMMEQAEQQKRKSKK